MPEWGERPLALVVPRDKDGLTATSCASTCARSDAGAIERFSVPDRYLFVDEIPKTSVGKIDKKQLREQYGTPRPERSDAQTREGRGLDRWHRHAAGASRRRAGREARAFLRFFNLSRGVPLADYSMSELRQLWRLLALALGRDAPVAQRTQTGDRRSGRSDRS